jgi:hypothetical protein
VGVRDDLLVKNPLGFSSLGLALPFCPGSFRALCRQAGQAAQEENRVGVAAALGAKALWYPEREIVAVADSTYASLKLLFRCRSLSRPVTFITRLRLDAALYEPAGPATTPPSDRETAPQGRASAESFSGGRRLEHRLEAHYNR